MHRRAPFEPGDSLMKGRILSAVAIGTLTTAAFMALSCVFASLGIPTLDRYLFWQNDLLQGALLLINVGSETCPIYEGSPLNFLAFLASVPLGIVVYGTLAYLASMVRAPALNDLSKRKR